jgi:hypothetical protein
MKFVLIHDQIMLLLIYVFSSVLIEENLHTFVHVLNQSQDINEIIIDYEIFVDFLLIYLI